ncbi:MAG: DUF5053 domain-containing protein [Odoribacter sp.]|nr:DUF5053 domain-containing protein [Odoribacter sp.]
MKLQKLWFDDKYICIKTDIGKVGKLPLNDFPGLRFATKEQRDAYELSPFVIHWLQLDEDLSYEGFFDYVPSLQSEVRRKLGELPDICNMGYIAQRYFGKTRQWLYQRLNGYLVNGKPVQFTQKEIKILNEALQDIGQKISSIIS